MMALLKRQFVLVGFAFAGVGLLLVAGVLLSLWFGSNPVSDLGTGVGGVPFAGWRAGIYGALVLLWPKLVLRIRKNRPLTQAALLNRRPVIILILLYEGLIVQNPLSILLAWGE